MFYTVVAVIALVTIVFVVTGVIIARVNKKSERIFVVITDVVTFILIAVTLSKIIYEVLSGVLR